MNKASFVKSQFARYSTELKRYIAHKFGDSGEAEDIVQDAFHNFLRSEAPENIENPRAYLYQTAHNLALNRIRKQRNHDAYLSANQLDDDHRSPERSVVAQRELEALQEVLESLPENCRKAFILSRIHNKTYTEIAEELKVSISSVEKYLMKSIHYLGEKFDESA